MYFAFGECSQRPVFRDCSGHLNRSEGQECATDLLIVHETACTVQCFNTISFVKCLNQGIDKHAHTQILKLRCMH
jgi:hypothetical protein